MQLEKKTKLSPKQRAFTREYVKSGNATQAAIKAGYEGKYIRQAAYETLTKPYIKKVIEEKQEKLEKKAQVDAEWVINSFLHIAKFNQQVEEFTQGEGDNVRVKKKMIDAAAATKAVEMLGKHLGIFNKDLSSTTNTQINFFQAANMQINESVQKLIAASPKQEKKKGIEGII